ncbi:ABC transporter permease [Empedobacter sp. GD03861]|uniref:ABC transporter permease n=1 Tax=Empedobacter sp. GD03861 TaxID=2975390 RepID=UPI00244A0255|nr:ABC transporter permease [Empedobacter sp. GD03861]MDH0674049.1 ABC transporter permease [Empedobacter sp. GD03861]
MKRLFSIEWNKLFYNKGTRIFIILYFVMILLMGITLPNFKPNMNEIEVDLIKLGALEFPIIWHNITWLIGFGKFFLAIIVINNITNEYSFGTFKQNTIDGLSKTEFLNTKVLMNVVITLISTLLVGVLVFALGSIFSEKFDFINGIEFLGGYFVEIFAYIVFAMFLSFLLKKSAFAILSLIVLNIVESVVKAIEFLVRFGKQPPSNPEEIKLLSNYLPLNSNGKIIDYPSVDIQQALMKSKLFVPDSIQWEYFGINVFYIILFLGLSLLIIKKRDL